MVKGHPSCVEANTHPVNHDRPYKAKSKASIHKYAELHALSGRPFTPNTTCLDLYERPLSAIDAPHRSRGPPKEPVRQ